MKTLKWNLLLLLLLPGLAQAGQPSPWDKKLPMKSATIRYAVSGMETGEEIVYIQDYGRRTATLHTSVMDMMGQKTQTKTLDIEDPNWEYTYDLITGTGTKSTNPLKFLREEYAKLTPAEQTRVQGNAEKLGLNMMGSMGGKLERNATKILGYPCDRITIKGTSVYSMHDTQLMLKMEANMMGMKRSVVATSLEKRPVAEKHFTHPAGIKAIYDPEADEMSREMAVATIAWLKNPQAASQASPMLPMMPEEDGSMSAEEQEMMHQAKEMMQGMFGE